MATFSESSNAVKGSAEMFLDETINDQDEVGKSTTPFYQQRLTMVKSVISQRQTISLRIMRKTKIGQFVWVMANDDTAIYHLIQNKAIVTDDVQRANCFYYFFIFVFGTAAT